MACNAQTIEISPVNVYWQIEAQESWDFADATAAGIGGKYVTMYLPTGVGYYAWFDENNTDADPAPSGLTAIEVNYAAGAVASAIATAFQTAVTAVTGFTATASGTVVTVVRDSVGEVTDADEGSADDFVVLTICKRGKDFDLGLIQGDVSLSTEPSNFIVQAHQSGVTPRASLFQGWSTIEVTTELLETQMSKLQELYGIYGGAFTPSGGTAVFGVGTSKQGQNLLIDGARLVMHPVNAADQTTDVNVMLAVPVPDSLVFSGENPRTLSVTWQGFADGDIDSRVSVLLFGDGSQADLEA